MYILNESKRDNFLIPYIEMFKSKGQDVTLGQLKTALLKKLTEEGGLRNLSLGSNFYLAGNGDLTLNKDLGIFNGQPDQFKEDVCERLNALILILRNSVVDSLGATFEQPEDFGTLTIDKLLKKYAKKINAELGIVDTAKKQVSSLVNGSNMGNGYTFDILYSYEDATKYYKPTSPGAWCITYGKQHFQTYTSRYKGHFVVFRKNGWEDIPRKIGAGWTEQKPQDEYGCSLIAYLQSNDSPEAVLITSRWNHGSGNISCEADHAFSQEEFMAKTEVTEAELKNIFDLWTQNRRKTSEGKKAEKKEAIEVMRDLKYRQMRINGGESPESALGMRGTSGKAEELAKYGIFGYMVDIRGKKYTVLLYKKNIIFESLIPYSILGYKYIFCLGERHYEPCNYINNAIVIKKADRFLIYDIKRHDFVNIEGKISFRCSMDRGYTSKYGDYYYMISESSSQKALVDSSNNKPLVLPNGHSWFEDIESSSYMTYSRKVTSVKLIDKNGIYIITYDEPRKEFYFFDARNNKFFDLPEFSDFDVVSSNRIETIIHYPLNAYLISSVNKKILIDIDTLQIISISGVSEFSYVDTDSIGLSIKLPNERDYFFYNPKLQSYLLLAGHPLHYTYNSSIFRKKGYIGFALQTNGGVNYLYILDLSKNELVINPETGNAQFISYSYGIPIYTDSTTELILTIRKGPQTSETVTYKLKELSKNTVPAFKPGSAPITIGKGENARNIEAAPSKSLNRELTTAGKINETVIKEIIRRSLSKSLDKEVIKKFSE